MLLDGVSHRSDGLHCLAQFVRRDTELLAPVPQFVILVDVNPFPIGAAADSGVVSHEFSVKGRDEPKLPATRGGQYRCNT
jgi:hypothetical protein